MGLFSVRGRLPQPAQPKSTDRLRATDSLAKATHRLRAVPARLGLLVRQAIRKIGKAVAARSGVVRRTAIAATNDARVVAVLLLLAAAALALEMAASFHVI
jgi:hypothetical protein